MSDQNDDPKGSDELTPHPVGRPQEVADADERTVFDAEMIERLNALGDDEDDQDDAAQVDPEEKDASTEEEESLENTNREERSRNIIVTEKRDVPRGHH